MKWVSWTNCVLAAWLIFAPFMFGYTVVRAALYEDVILGIVIASVALWRALRADTESMARLSWVVAAAGFWAMMAPFVLGYGTTRAPVDNDVLVGLAVLILGIWRATSRPRGEIVHRLAHR